MKNIAILGCGNLGRRHLQSAVKTQQALNIYVYDINQDVFTLAKYNEAIIDIANSNSQTVANPYADISDFLLEDGHHLNSVGVDAVYKSVDSYLMGLLDSNE